jgi:hypothetical protein
MILFYLLGVWLAAAGTILFVYRIELQRLWREPVLRQPVLIVESDDWGAGPLSQAEALSKLSSILARFRDCQGRHPVMTMAIILAVPDGKAIGATGQYHRLELGHDCFRPIRDALKSGQDLKVFSLQLHGLEHYWPATLMSATEPGVQQWLKQDDPPSTESLVPHYQSRWINASTLPSRTHDPRVINTAVEDEAVLYVRILGQQARVAVPPTFIWNEEVEQAWARRGVKIVVTPGRRYCCRNERGEPDCAGPVILSGDRGNGVTYVVRNDYFEPHKGHTAERGIDALRRRTHQGRACLLETHRVNFITAGKEQAYEELEHLMERALHDYPGLRFMDTLELGHALDRRDDSTIESRYLPRLAAWIARSDELPRFSRLGRLTGMMPALRLAVSIANFTVGRCASDRAGDA